MHKIPDSLVIEELFEAHAKRAHRYNQIIRAINGQDPIKYTPEIKESAEKGLREMFQRLPGHDNMSEEEIEDLASDSHERWCNHWRSKGYTTGGAVGQRDDVAKTHGSLIPYSELPESEKAKDRIFVFHALHVLEDWLYFGDGFKNSHDAE